MDQGYHLLAVRLCLCEGNVHLASQQYFGKLGLTKNLQPQIERLARDRRFATLQTTSFR